MCFKKVSAVSSSNAVRKKTCIRNICVEAVINACWVTGEDPVSERERGQFMVYAVDPLSATVAAACCEKVTMRVIIASRV